MPSDISERNEKVTFRVLTQPALWPLKLMLRQKRHRPQPHFLGMGSDLLFSVSPCLRGELPNFGDFGSPGFLGTFPIRVISVNQW